MKTITTSNLRVVGSSRRSRFCSRQLPCSRSHLSQFALAPHILPREIHHRIRKRAGVPVSARHGQRNGEATYMKRPSAHTDDQRVNLIDGSLLRPTP